jgi:hypothetical protein
MTREGELLAVDPDGTARLVPNTYEGIKAGLHDATLDFVRPNDQAGFYVDDNGMIEAQPLNVPVSVMAGMALYGSAVLCGPDPDPTGETLPPTEMAVNALTAIAEAWRHVVADAARKGQVIFVYPEPGRIPPARFISLEDEGAFMRYLFGDEVPDE